jgi:hypothetical protein
MPLLSGILDFVGNTLPWTPMGRGILAAREQQQMAQYRQQQMEMQKQEWAHRQQEWNQQQSQIEAAKSAFKPGAPPPDQIPITPQVGSPGYDQARQKLDQVQVGANSPVDYLRAPQSAAVQAMAAAGQFGTAAQFLKESLPKEPEWREETVGGLQGQRNAQTGKFDPFPQAATTERPLTPIAQLRADWQAKRITDDEYKAGLNKLTQTETEQSRGSQGGAILIPGKGVRQSRFKNGEYEFMDDDGQWKTTPPGTVPTSVQTDSPGQKFQMGNSLRDDYRAVSGEFKAIQDAYQRISSVPESPAGDLSMLYSYVKLLDPGSVVRESEFATAATARPLLERLGISWDAVSSLWQGKRMTPSMRKDFLNAADKIYEGADDIQASRDQQYEALAKEYQLDPRAVVTGIRSGAVKRRNAAPAQQSAGGGSVLDEARAAIAAGAPRDKVIERLRKNGIDPGGL